MKYPQLVSMPSAVSDWLEEQLEALGIDSAIYTRYILSLLHADSSDVICPEDDFFSSTSKKQLEGNRGSAVSNKRLKRAKSWRRHAQADAEQIKRSAAVNCLMSAAEQSCEIESIVDELCEKLRKINSGRAVSPTKNFIDESATIIEEKVSPKELAEKYYAAFPALNQKLGTSYFSSNVSLAPDKWPSSKPVTNSISAKWTLPDSVKKPKRKCNNRRPIYENTMRASFREGPNRNRLGHKRTHCGRNLSREVADNIANWEITCNGRCHREAADFLDNTNEVHKIAGDANTQVGRMKVWLANVDPWKDHRPLKKNSMVKRRRLFDNNNQHVPLYSRALWSLPTEDLRRNALANYINDLYSTTGGLPSENDYTSAENQTFTTTLDDVEPEVTALREEYYRSPARKLSEDEEEEEEETAIKEEYNRPHHRSSMQDSFAKLPTDCSLEDPAVQAAFEACIFENANDLAMQFWDTYSPYLRPNSGRMAEDSDFMEGLVMEDDLQKQDDEFMKQNQVNNLLEEMEESCAVSAERLLKDDQEDDVLTSRTVSLMMVNHSAHHGAFREYRRPLVARRGQSVANAFDFCVKKPSPLIHSGATPPQIEVQYTYCVTEEQKRQSPNMYFEPLEVLLARDQLKERNENRIKDGTTFDIPGNIDEVKFQRTGSGSLFLETEFGEYRKYYEYKRQSPCDDLLKLPNSGKSSQSQFRVKYAVSQNDKACQTEEDLITSASSKFPCQRNQRTSCCLPPTFDFFSAFEPYKVIQHHGGVSNPGIMDRAIENIGDVDEVVWGYAPKNSNVFCKHCSAEHPWPANLPQDVNCDLKDIWAGTELCGLCGWSNKAPTLLAETTMQLREESREEAERLLSDLSSLRLSNSTGRQIFESPLFTGLKEKKRRHSLMDTIRGDVWSIANILQKDCLASLPTIPARRSVTL